MDGPPPVPPDALIAEQAWMRALARRLASPSAADDLIQAANVRALETPRRPRASLRGWLASVLRNVAREERRAGARRLRHERGAARADVAATPVDRLAAHQDVVRAVLALAEPYRTAVIRRFYEELPPRAIAAREGVPVATVKSRVHRGLELLRARLGSERTADGRSKLAALVPALAAPLRPSAGAMPAGALLAMTTPATLAASSLALLGALFWVGLRLARDEPEPAPASASVAARQAPVQEPAAVAPVVVPDAADGRTALGHDAAPERRPSAAAQPVSSRPLVLSFRRPDGAAFAPSFARAELVDDAGGTRGAESREAASVRFEGVVPGDYRLALTASGARPLSLPLAVGDELVERGSGSGGLFPGGARPDAEDDAPYSVRVTLWPESWVGVRVRSEDGRSFTALAADDGLEPKRYFVDAFALAASAGVLAHAPGGGPPSSDGVARFHPAPGYQNVEVSEGVAGALELFAPPPLEVGLWVHGAFLDAATLAQGDEEVVFTLSRAELHARLATVDLRLIERERGAPVTGARVTLKAATSAHRRGGLSDVAPDDDGRVRLERVVPGRHELFVEREGHAVQRWLELVAGEERALGDVPIGAGPALPVRVVDEAGRPVLAVLEIAPYERGRSVDELYHPNLSRTTDEDGRGELPVPDRESIVRARGLTVRSLRAPGGLGAPVSSGNVLLAPGALPAELVLVSRPRAQVRLEPRAPWVAGDRLRFVDELGLVVLEVASEGAEELEAELVAGAYDVERWRAEVLVGHGPAVVSEGDEALRVP